MRSIRLGVNIDHVATVRNARGGSDPDPVRAALLALDAGADGITLHLREDRRHIRDDDLLRLRNAVQEPINLEMAATPEMVAIALATLPHAACLVPERREEVTTEGGLDAAGNRAALPGPCARRCHDAGRAGATGRRALGHVGNSDPGGGAGAGPGALTPCRDRAVSRCLEAKRAPALPD